jgi:hypothetical protein
MRELFRTCRQIRLSVHVAALSGRPIRSSPRPSTSCPKTAMFDEQHDNAGREAHVCLSSPFVRDEPAKCRAKSIPGL